MPWNMNVLFVSLEMSPDIEPLEQLQILNLTAWIGYVCT
jgi:hypothetical protein